MNSSLRLFVALLVCSFFSASQAADPVVDYTYTGEIEGVVCASCKEHVALSLMRKLDGVVSVDVKPGEKTDGPQKLIIVAKNAAITKESATEALGTFAKNYQIVSLTKKS